MARYTVKDEKTGNEKTVVTVEPRFTVPEGYEGTKRPDHMKNYRSTTRYTTEGRIEEEWWMAQGDDGVWHDMHRLECDGTLIALEMDGVDITHELRDKIRQSAREFVQGDSSKA